MGFGIFVLLLHYTVVLLYSNPLTVAKTKAEFYAHAYIYPFFHQNWNLFVPVPDSNYNLFCRFNGNGEEVVDLFEEVSVAHQTNRLKGLDLLVLAFSNSIHQFEKNTPCQAHLNQQLGDDINFMIIERICRNYIGFTRKIKIDDLKIILVVTSNATKKQRIYYN